jgi:hypothetical protein
MRWRRCIRSSTLHLFIGLPLECYDLMRLDDARLRVTSRLATAYTFAAAAIEAVIWVCDADHCGFVCCWLRSAMDESAFAFSGRPTVVYVLMRTPRVLQNGAGAVTMQSMCLA